MFPISSSLGPPLPPLTLSLAQGMVTVAETAHLSAPTGSAGKRGPSAHPACLHQASAGAWGRQQQDGHPAERAPAQKCTAVPALPHEYWLAPSCGSSQASHCERLPFVSLLSPQSLAPRGIFPFHLGMNRTSQRDESSVGRFTFQAS